MIFPDARGLMRMNAMSRKVGGSGQSAGHGCSRCGTGARSLSARSRCGGEAIAFTAKKEGEVAGAGLAGPVAVLGRGLAPGWQNPMLRCRRQRHAVARKLQERARMCCPRRSAGVARAVRWHHEDNAVASAWPPRCASCIASFIRHFDRPKKYAFWPNQRNLPLQCLNKVTK